jgi:hypothetical protein
MLGLARVRAEEIGGYIYGDDENGGTGTFYVSPVPFEKIEAELREREKERFFFPKDPHPLREANIWAYATLATPVAAVAGAVLAGARAVGAGGRRNPDKETPSPNREERAPADAEREGREQ